LHGVAPFEQFVTTAIWRIMTPMVQEPSTPSALPPFHIRKVDDRFGSTAAICAGNFNGNFVRTAVIQ